MALVPGPGAELISVACAVLGMRGALASRSPNAGMCIGHLGHLHHTHFEQRLAHIGQLDVVMVPVDGSTTMDVAGDAGSAAGAAEE